MIGLAVLTVVVELRLPTVRFGTTVVLAMLNGAVPVATVLVIGCENEFGPVQLLAVLVEGAMLMTYGPRGAAIPVPLTV